MSVSKVYLRQTKLEKERDMSVFNFPPRLRTQKLMGTVENIAEKVATGILLSGNNPVLTQKDGTEIAVGAIAPPTIALVNNNNCDGTDKTTLPPSSSQDPQPDTIEATELGAIVCRNIFAHVGGPYTNDGGTPTFHLDLRGYNKCNYDQTFQDRAGRTLYNYAGLQLYHGNDDVNGDQKAFFVLSSGADHTTTMNGSVPVSTDIDYRSGESFRFAISDNEDVPDPADRELIIQAKTVAGSGLVEPTWKNVAMFTA